MTNKEHPRNDSEQRETLWQKVRLPIACGTLAFALISLANELTETSDDHDAQATDLVQEQQTILRFGTPIEPTFFDKMAIISVDDPTDSMKPFVSADQLTYDFTNAVELISEAVDGDLSVPTSIPVVKIENTPEGRDSIVGSDATRPCYAKEDLKQIYASAVNKLDITDDTIAPIVLQGEAVTCKASPNVLAYVARSDEAEDDGIFYARSLRYDMENNDRAKVHELGHVMGLAHSLEVAKHGDKRSLSGTRVGSKDISSLTGERGDYKLVMSFSDGKLVRDEYASNTTVMGGLTPSTSGGDVFNFVEINQIDNARSRIQLIDTSIQQNYNLSTKSGNEYLRGIAIKLPENHPLRATYKDEGELDYILLGLDNLNGDDMATLSVIGRFADRHTISFDIGSYIPTLDYDIEGDVVVYTDATLGFKVIATAKKPNPDSLDSEVSLHVETIPAAK